MYLPCVYQDTVTEKVQLCIILLKISTRFILSWEDFIVFYCVIYATFLAAVKRMMAEYNAHCLTTLGQISLGYFQFNETDN